MPAPPESAAEAGVTDDARRALERVFEIAIARLADEDRLPRRRDHPPERLRHELGIAVGRDGVARARRSASGWTRKGGS